MTVLCRTSSIMTSRVESDITVPSVCWFLTAHLLFQPSLWKHNPSRKEKTASNSYHAMLTITPEVQFTEKQNNSDGSPSGTSSGCSIVRRPWNTDDPCMISGAAAHCTGDCRGRVPGDGLFRWTCSAKRRRPVLKWNQSFRWTAGLYNAVKITVKISHTRSNVCQKRYVSVY